jgi:hypothetical protein
MTDPGAAFIRERVPTRWAMYVKYRQSFITFIIFLAMVGSFLATWPTGKAYAGPPLLDLEIDSSETVHWDTGNITPGDSGLEPVTLRNTGNVTGYLCIWIGDIIDDEGANPESETGNTTNPGELSSYLYLDIINEGMTFIRLMDNGYRRVALPVRLIDFPADMSHALCIMSNPLGAGQALELQWQWTFSPDAGNDAQGDTVSFSIFYSLIPDIFTQLGVIPPTGPLNSENAPPEPTPPPEITEPEAPATSTPPSGEDTTPETEPATGWRIFVSEDGRCFLYVLGDVRVATDDNKELLDIFIDIPNGIPLVPESYIIGSPVYRFYCETPDGITGGARLTHDVQLIIYFEPDRIPGNTEVSLFSYHPDSGWTRLDCHGNPSRGWLSAWTDNLDMVAVLALSGESTVISGEPVVPDVPVTAGISHDNSIYRQVSLGVAVSGTLAMTVLAGLQRRRRNASGRSNTDVSVDR